MHILVNFILVEIDMEGVTGTGALWYAFRHASDMTCNPTAVIKGISSAPFAIIVVNLRVLNP